MEPPIYYLFVGLALQIVGDFPVAVGVYPHRALRLIFLDSDYPQWGIVISFYWELCIYLLWSIVLISTKRAHHHHAPLVESPGTTGNVEKRWPRTMARHVTGNGTAYYLLGVRDSGIAEVRLTANSRTEITTGSFFGQQFNRIDNYVNVHFRIFVICR